MKKSQPKIQKYIIVSLVKFPRNQLWRSEMSVKKVLMILVFRGLCLSARSAQALEVGNFQFDQPNGKTCGPFSGGGSFFEYATAGSATSSNGDSIIYLAFTIPISSGFGAGGASGQAFVYIVTFDTTLSTYSTDVPANVVLLGGGSELPSGTYTGSIVNAFGGVNVNVTLNCGTVINGTTQYIGQ